MTYQRQNRQLQLQKQQEKTKSVLIVKIATYVAVTLFVFVSIIQLGIALGIVPITIIWGSSQHELTFPLRIASIVACMILLLFAYVIYQRSTIVLSSSVNTNNTTNTTDSTNNCSGWIRYGSWFVTVYMFLNTLGNFTSENYFEKYVFGTITLILGICSFIVSSSSSSSSSLSQSGGVVDDTITDGQYTTIGEAEY